MINSWDRRASERLLRISPYLLSYPNREVSLSLSLSLSFSRSVEAPADGARGWNRGGNLAALKRPFRCGRGSAERFFEMQSPRVPISARVLAQFAHAASARARTSNLYDKLTSMRCTAACTATIVATSATYNRKARHAPRGQRVPTTILSTISRALRRPSETRQCFERYISHRARNAQREDPRILRWVLERSPLDHLAASAPRVPSVLNHR